MVTMKSSLKKYLHRDSVICCGISVSQYRPPVLFMKHRICKTMDVTSGTGTAHPSGESGIHPGLLWSSYFSVYSCLSSVLYIIDFLLSFYFSHCIICSCSIDGFVLPPQRTIYKPKDRD